MKWHEMCCFQAGMAIDLWDMHGQAVAYIDDDKQSIYMWDGTPVAWLWGTGIYTYRGKLLGWFFDGWIFGLDGKCVLFTERGAYRPVKPLRQPPGSRGDKGVRPSRGEREPARKQPERSLVWSSVNALSFLRQ